MRYKNHFLILLAALAAVPGIALRLLGVSFAPPETALIAGAAIVGASFLLLWACDAAQADISQSLALAVVALIAVLPEYAVDMYFTWQAGRHEDSAYAHYAIANMTGANRLLIGVAWGLIAFISYMRHRGAVMIEAERRLELFFLGLATVYALVIPIKGTLAWYDAIVFLAMYGWYIVLAGKRPRGECEAEGPAELLVRLPTTPRRMATAALFVFAAGAILTNAKPFCEGLIGTGKQLRINEFLLVQWLAPIASEAPEFIVAIGFAWRGRAGTGLGSLLSAKLNQWTLLVGMIPAVFAVAHGTLAHPIPMGSFQMHEILLTAAQSLLAVVLLASMRFTMGGAMLLFGLFAGQLIAPTIVEAFPAGAPFGLQTWQIHPIFSLLYVAAAAAIFFHNPRLVYSLRHGIRAVRGDSPADQGPRGASDAVLHEAENDVKTPHCVVCRWRLRAVDQAQLPAASQPPCPNAGTKTD